MRVCRLKRPWMSPFWKGYPQRREHIFKRIAQRGHKVVDFEINPVPIPLPHLAYSMGILRSFYRFKHVRPSLVVAEDMEAALLGIWAKKIVKVPFVFDFIDDYSRIIQFERQPFRGLAVKCLEKIVPRLADMVIVVDPIKKAFCKSLGVPEEKLAFIPNGCDPTVFRPKNKDLTVMRELGLDPKDRLMLFVGKLNQYYNIEVLIASLPIIVSNIPELKLIIVGEGKQQQALMQFSEKLGMASFVRFVGYRQYNVIPEIINLAEVCVFPIPVGSALVLYEYMACGKAVVVPDGGTVKMGIPRSMFPENCIVRVDNSPEGFAEGSLKLLFDKNLSYRMGSNARRLVSDLYTWDLLGDRYLEVLKKVWLERGSD